MSATVILVKRLPNGDFQGDVTWQVAPYPVKSREHAERLVEWLRKAFSKTPCEYRVAE